MEGRGVMAVRKLRSKQFGPECSFCDERAIWRGFMFNKFACAAHRSALVAWDRKATAPDYSDAAFYGGWQ